MRVLLLNGPNLNLLGVRDPDRYGSTTLDQLETDFRGWAADLGVSEVTAHQSNHEGELIDRLHAARGTVDGIVFNPGALTHTSYALHDAIDAIDVPTVEVHISNVEEREPWRRISLVRPACVHTIYGRGVDGYRWALRHLVASAACPVEVLRYGDHPEHVADLRLPDGPGPHPLAVLVHGGFWRHHWTRDTTDLLAVDLRSRGVASLNVEYRRVGEAGGDGRGAAAIDDVVEAILLALDHADIDPYHWSVAGHSAGGHLAMLAGRVLAGMDMREPRLVVAMAGVLDLPQAIADDLGDGAVPAYLGGRDPAILSPAAVVPVGAPTLLAHGTADARVPLSQSERYLAAAEAAGDDVELLVGDHDHFAFLQPDDPAWTAVAERMVAALR